jgi:GTP cyclohydrolase I
VNVNTHNDIEDAEYLAAIELRKRPVTDDQFRKFEGYAAEIFSSFGLDLNTPATKDTPRRFIRALYDATEGYDGDTNLLRVFDTECRGEPDCRLSQVIEGPIHFFALCEHHALPFYGSVYIGYIANDKIIGISKLTRLVRLFSKRFAVQERIGQQLADSLEAMLHPNGVAVFVEAHHLCVEMRGVREMAPITRTSVWRGHYADDPALRSEFISASRLQHV